MALIGFVATVAMAALGVVEIVRLTRRQRPLVTLRLSHRPSPLVIRRTATALAAGLASVVLTRWLVAGLLATACVLLWPRFFGGGKAGQRALEKIEAIAAWTESLRDMASAAAGLEQAIPATGAAAQPFLKAPVRELSARLDGRVPLAEALARFADDVDDPAADLVVAALTLNARQRANGLERLLTALATSSRVELEMRRKVEHERRLLRRQAHRIAGAVLGFVSLQAAFAHGWVSPYGSVVGQVVLGVLSSVFLAAFVRMRSLSEGDAGSRFLVEPIGHLQGAS